MIEFLTNNFVPLLFGGLLAFLLSGFPVAFALAATGLFFGYIGMEIGLFPPNLFQALPLRVFGIMQNETLLAIPFFTLMGIILERSRMAEALLSTVAQVFGPVRGGLAVAVILVGALLAATTGVVAAAVISMGLISLPIMLRYGYNRTIAMGTITASGTLAQAIPPSLVLIVLADQMGRSVGDMYAGALIPGLMLVGLYLLFIAAVAIVLPRWVPALPKEARIYVEPSGASGHRSLLVLLAISAVAGWLWSQNHEAIINPLIERQMAPGGDEVVIMSISVASVLALVLALLNRLFRLRLLSRLAEQVTFVLIPPLVLIFLVLGTIFLGVATPTEGGAMGALGALIMAASRRTLSLKLMHEALESTTKLSIFVLFILIGSTVFSFTFNAADGHVWVEHLFDKLPGGQMGFLLVVNFLVFILGFFIDFFEIAFIVVPLLVPVAQSLDINLIWFGVILAMNMQTSFLTPPFGFALFYLRSVAARQDYTDKVTGKLIPAVTTAQIYKGSIAFIVLQLIMVAVVMLNPGIVTGSLGAPVKVDNEAVQDLLRDMAPPTEGGGYGTTEEEEAPAEEPSADELKPEAEGAAPAEVDPNKALEEALKPKN
ncbi:MAG: TRAP transporter large permease subunit [Hydrogenophaga sp.]|uniref:TRAP transporter large permease n=1 Tax=Hydrogenophaga sp. TaxID=1904254 RepID=UPI00169C55D4|nr:TRAP transporter large permease subunit [Hydrogenophaga sp.]NIM41865.1 TRAP transporter large permease subunit [Hydrogenophaga sp.]NIN27170.1 TRAP transporter large permease subunit [Hydrogenophaga sp.]NIN31871.1 TRAP transporter large permease subunit [Hydrogenophaga sp.]NIN56115.1 TRAP transporter large permease subunit [Hydrogenophaga sp.]NIO52242.1 TRAP transporter large permease subunit [Hydrogenophaga sp.]